MAPLSLPKPRTARLCPQCVFDTLEDVRFGSFNIYLFFVMIFRTLILKTGAKRVKKNIILRRCKALPWMFIEGIFSPFLIL